jgi:hypothetical protein
MKSLFSLLFGLLLSATTSFAQDGTPPTLAAKNIQQSQSRVAPLTNQDLIELLQAKLTPDEMIAKIKSSPANFDTSDTGLHALKDAGLPEVVIAAIMQIEKSGAISTIPDSTSLELQEQQKTEPEKPAEITIPAGTQLDVEAAYTVNSLDVKPGDLISFRVLVPIKVDGHTVIDKGALVTARVVVAKRGGHWGRSGRLSWAMQDVLAVDGTRLPIQPEGQMGSDELSRKPAHKSNENLNTSNSVKGTSHSREVMTRILISGAFFPPLAPIGLIHGFKRGENAVLPEGRRFFAFVGGNAKVTVLSRR